MSAGGNGQRFTLLQHKMQAGVKADQESDPRLATLHLREPMARHLKMERVGINSALVETSALIALLVEKGVITEDEWWASACKGMQAEVERYEKLLSERFGQPVVLDTPFIDPVAGTRRV